jgi:mRNA-degrading endonuclease RelE of RelBE toxin-antitoxin system
MKTFHFEFSPHSEQTFALFSKPFQKRLLDKLEFFENSGSALKYAKKLKGLDDLYRFRVGDYRILVRPRADGSLVVLVILKIAHRKEAYESL